MASELMKVFCVICVFTVCCEYDATAKEQKLIQERPEVTYVNPKYMKDVVVRTGRRNRHDFYKTNITSTILHEWNNNVTIVVTYKSGSNDIVLDFKICDALKKEWIKSFIDSFSQSAQLHCPINAGTYSFFNIEIPPKNFPLPMPKVVKSSTMTLSISQTNTKEIIADGKLHFRVA